LPPSEVGASPLAPDEPAKTAEAGVDAADVWAFLQAQGLSDLCTLLCSVRRGLPGATPTVQPSPVLVGPSILARRCAAAAAPLPPYRAPPAAPCTHTHAPPQPAAPLLATPGRPRTHARRARAPISRAARP
jgi:hypothetical protein